MSATPCRHAITLIEMLIVVLIAAVLAATIIPQFAPSTTDAEASALKFNLHGLRRQIEMYKAQHHGAVPALSVGTLPGLIYATDADGNTNNSIVPDISHTLGPYTQGGQLPVNPFDGTNTVTQVSIFPPTATSGSGQGWLYEPSSGQIAPNTAGHLTD